METAFNKEFKAKSDKLKADLASLSESFASSESKFKDLVSKVKAKANGDSEDVYCDIMNEVYAMVRYCHERIDNIRNAQWNLEDAVWRHSTKGHLPPLGAAAMNSLLEVCGMDGDYTAAKKTLSCAKTHKISVDFSNG